MKHYDAIVIGSGQAGTPLSKKLANAGLKTALIEKRWIGGTCVNDGCSPTKAMIASAKAAWSAYHNKDIGVFSEIVKLDFAAILRRKDNIVQMMRDNSEQGILETENLDLYYGSAQFTAERELSITMNDGTTEKMSADQIFINTGEKPEIPAIDGLEETGYLTSTTLLELNEVPEHLLVIGSGYIGLEFGQMYSRFGSKVTILESSQRILKREDEDISQEITKILSDENIKLLTGSKAVSVLRNGDRITVELEINGEKNSVECTHILVAAGREPQTAMLNPEAAGIELDNKGYIKVNEKLETNVKGIYALGDVKGGPAFTHIAFDDYRIIAANVIRKENKTTEGRMVPYCMFIDPQLGRIGITEQEAKKQGLNVKVATLKNSSVARSIETGDERGMMKAVVDAATGKILGASILAEQGGEIVTILQMAMMGGVTYDQILNGVFAHPTYAESLNNLFMTLEK